MLAVAVLGRRAAASAWSPNEEERRKALFAYLGEGVALLVWDNIPRGAAISCPSIEKALTAETYKDRILGVSENRTVPASHGPCLHRQQYRATRRHGVALSDRRGCP